MNSHQDTRRISSEELASLFQSTRRQAHEMRLEVFKGFFRGSAAALKAVQKAAGQGLVRLLSPAHAGSNNSDAAVAS